jgi:hypothetical protein
MLLAEAGTIVADVIFVAASGILEKSLAASSAQSIFALTIPGTGRVEPVTVWALTIWLAPKPIRTSKMTIVIKIG